MKLVDSLSDRQLDLLIRYIAIAITVLAIGLTVFYVRDRYVQSNVSVVDRETERLKEMIIKDPDNVRNRLAIANVFFARGSYDDAIVQYNEVLKVESESEDALMGLGLAYVEKGQDEKALGYFQAIVLMHEKDQYSHVRPNLNRSYYHMGRLSIKKGMAEQAIEYLEKAYQINRADADTIYLLGSAFLQKGDLENAKELFGMAIAFVPDFTEAYQGLVAVYERSGDKREVEYHKGMIALSSRDFDGAIRQLDQVIAADPQHARAYTGLGRAYEGKNQKEKAYEAYNKAADLDPEGQKLAAEAAKKLEVVLK